MNNIKVKLISAFILILIIPALSIGSLSYKTAKDAVENEITHGIDQNISLLNATIDNTIQGKINDAEVYSKLITKEQYNENNIPELRHQFDQYLQFHPEVEAIYVGTSTGSHFAEPYEELPAGFDPREREWYKKAMSNKGTAAISEPYVSTSGSTVIAIAIAAQDGSGVIGIDISLKYLQELTNQIKIGDKGYAMLLDGNKKFIAHPTNDGGSEATESFYDQMYKKNKGQFTYKYKNEDKIMNFVTNSLTGWKIAGNLYSSEISNAAAPIAKKTFIIISITLLLGAIIIFFILKSVMKPLKELKEKAVTISRGDLSENININSKDEIGQLGHAFNNMQDSLRKLIQKVESNASQVAAAAEELTASAEQTTESTEQVSKAIQEVSCSSEKQTSGVEQTAKSIEGIAQGISFISNNAIKVAELSRDTMNYAENGEKAVTDTVNQMMSIHDSVLESNTMIQSLRERSKEVSSILNVITAISEQTNLLSLNAAIEAARAGEHGRGFSVVAEEVRKLAEQSQQSAKEIDQIVQRIHVEIENAVQLMVQVTKNVESGVEVSKEAIEKFEQILEGTEKITPQMENISTTTQQIASSIQEVNATANDLSFIAQENAASSEEVAASTEEQLASMQEISASAQALSKMAEELTQAIAQFKY